MNSIEDMPIRIIKSCNTEGYWVNDKFILNDNIHFHEKGTKFTTEELEALNNFIDNDNK